MNYSLKSPSHKTKQKFISQQLKYKRKCQQLTNYNEQTKFQIRSLPTTKQFSFIVTSQFQKLRPAKFHPPAKKEPTKKPATLSKKRLFKKATISPDIFLANAVG